MTLLANSGIPELGPGPRKNVLPHQELEKSLAEILSQSELDSLKSDLIRAVVLLWHDRLDAAHGIAQGIEDADGSFIHGIVHRREPDYGNARYWFRRVGEPDFFPNLAHRIGALLDSKGASTLKTELVVDGKWDSLAFVDRCQKVSTRPPADPEVMLLREIQGLESEVLLQHLFTS